MQIGKLNKRIIIKTVTRTADGLGGFTEVASTVKETWASVFPFNGRESLQYGLEAGERSCEVVLRFDGVINQTNYIEYNNRTFRINSVVNTDERKHEYRLICTERTD
jgi:SPP1 family predicted phage head-tail adaptor